MFLSEHDSRVLRFWVYETEENIEGVIETILGAFPTREPPSSLPPRAGGGPFER
jgi:very-short-patch-repair endonuclease